MWKHGIYVKNDTAKERALEVLVSGSGDLGCLTLPPIVAYSLSIFTCMQVHSRLML